MRYFTESPFERMMMQKPSASPAVSDSAANTGCEGCGYGGKRPCIAVCMRKLVTAGKAGKQKKAM